MSTAARKARKKAGVQFVHPVKVGTPLMERFWFTALLRGERGTRHDQNWLPRSLAKRNRALKARGMKELDE